MAGAQEELKFLGFFGIYKESFKIIFKWRKIFSQITLALILPLSLIFLAYFQISQIVYLKIFKKEETLKNETPVDTPSYTKRSHPFSSQWTAYWLFEVAYLTVFLILFLLSTSAVVYTISCIYTAKEISFKKVMSVLPKVWKRIAVTFFCNYAVVFVYNIVAAVLLILLIMFIRFVHHTLGIVVLVVLVILYLAGLVYITIVWHLASVVSVLENIKGFKAMVKGKALIKGNMGVAVAFLFLLTICFVGIALTYESIVVLGIVSGGGLGIRIGIGILCFLLLIMVILTGLVIQTVIYFVCKSNHKDVQLEQFHV